MSEIKPNDKPDTTPVKDNSSSLVGSTPERIFPFISVEFKGHRRLLFSNPMEFPFIIGDKVVVRVEKGEDLGTVNHLLELLPENRPEPEHEVLRRATPKDLKTLEEYRVRENGARDVFKEKVVKHALEMKLVDVEYQFDGRKLIFYFTADGRIDFRQLVKDLAATFRTRIELRQIGARDETRRFGGLGPCGRRLCCVTFIQEFCPITTQMAKDMNLPLNPSKISGCCGRLKCCLQYELEVYRTALEVLPRWDTRLETNKGPAVVEKLDVFDHEITIRYNSGDLEKIDVRKLDKILVSDYSPAESSPSQSGLTELEDEVISDDLDNGCTNANLPTSSPAAQKQRKSDKRRQPGPQKRSGKFASQNRNRNHPRSDRKNDYIKNRDSESNKNKKH